MKNKKKTIDPGLKQILTELEEVIERLGYKTRYEKGNFEGGYCVLKESRLIVINNRNEIEKRISIITKCLKEIGIHDIFIKPHLREIIEAESAKGVTAGTESGNPEFSGDEEDSDDEAVNEEIQEPKS
jgi:hypothetical protein